MTNKYTCKNMLFRLVGVLLLLSAVQGSYIAPSRADEYCDPYDSRVTTTPSPMQRGASLRRYDYVLEHFPKAADVVIFGDSLAEKWPDDELRKIFPGKIVVNLGVNADTTQWSLWRLNNSPMLQISPETVILVLGTNNLKGATACAINVGLRTVILKINSLWPSATIYMLTIAPRGPIFNDSEEDISIVNKYLVSLAEKYKFLKIVTGFDEEITCGKRGVSAIRWLISPYFPISCENYIPDNLHFSEEGYKIIGDFLKRAMQ